MNKYTLHLNVAAIIGVVMCLGCLFAPDPILHYLGIGGLIYLSGCRP